jgi:hypothetical protein
MRYAGKGKLTLIACLSLDLWGQVPIRGQWWVVCEPKRGEGGPSDQGCITSGTEPKSQI